MKSCVKRGPQARQSSEKVEQAQSLLRPKGRKSLRLTRRGLDASLKAYLYYTGEMHHDGQGTRLPVRSSYLPRVIALKLISDCTVVTKRRDGLPEFDGKMRVEHRHPRLGSMAGGVNGDIPASIYQCDERV